MSNKTFRIRSWLKYLWKAQSNLYIHSPFVFDFYNQLLKRSKENDELRSIRKFRKQISGRKIEFRSYGTGPDIQTTTAPYLEQNVAIKHKYGKLLYNLIKYFNIKNVLEVGSNIGISTIYLAKAADEGKVVTLEGAETLIKIAKENFVKSKCENISIFGGEFDKNLDKALRSMESVDLIFFDGNHAKEPTLRYFQTALPFAKESTIFIFDDIYWSEEMAEAWEKIKEHSEVTVTIDVYQFGIVFFTDEIKVKQDFVLRY